MSRCGELGGRRDGGDGGGGRVVCFGMGRWHGWGCLLFGR